MCSRGFIVSTLIALVAMLAAVSILPTRLQIPAHLRGHPMIDRLNFLDAETVEDLLAMTRGLGSIPGVARNIDANNAHSQKLFADFGKRKNHMGEASPYDAVNKRCAHPLLIPDAEKKECVFPGRIDVARHFITTGGIQGMKESYDTMVSRTQPFIKYIFNYSEHPVAKRLLESPKFRAFAPLVCPAERQVLDFFQFNLVVQVPGQTVSTHIDTPVFYHANRFQIPQWLCVVMMFSGLFHDDFAPQVQVVTYYHKWTTSEGGEFFFWNKPGSKEGSVSLPISRSVNSVDGSKVIHAANVFKPSHAPPPLKQSATSDLRYDAETKNWTVFSDGVALQTYEESEIRFAAVYRARCFRDAADLEAFRYAQEHQWPLEHILDILRADLKKKGIIRPDQEIRGYDLGVLLMDTYIKYPLPMNAIIPFNYCAIDKLFPAVKPYLRWLCN